jgi:hypothetical protein
MRCKISKLIRVLAIVSTLTLGLVLLLGGTAAAITNGQPDGEGHPYVCCVVVFDEYGNFIGSGSGTLISPTVVLTAGHVTDAGPNIFVTFASDLTQAVFPDDYIYGVPYTHPEFQLGAGPGLPNYLTHDVGVIALTAPAPVTEYGALPGEGSIDSLGKKTDLDLVGYGYNYRDRPSQEWVFFGARYYAPSRLIPSNHVNSDEFIKTTSNPAQGKGGTTFGDSGGPVLLGGTNVILGITSYCTNYNSAGLGYAARADTADVLEWVNGFLP